jgi:transketolase
MLSGKAGPMAAKLKECADALDEGETPETEVEIEVKEAPAANATSETVPVVAVPPLDVQGEIAKALTAAQVPDLVEAVQVIGETVLSLSGEIKALKEALTLAQTETTAAKETAVKAQAETTATQEALAIAQKAVAELRDDNMPRFNRLFRASKESAPLTAEKQAEYRKPEPPAAISAIAAKISGQAQ